MRWVSQVRLFDSCMYDFEIPIFTLIDAHLLAFYAFYLVTVRFLNKIYNVKDCCTFYSNLLAAGCYCCNVYFHVV